ncbi:hypothetical protein [Halochromatium sp.]
MSSNEVGATENAEQGFMSTSFKVALNAHQPALTPHRASLADLASRA